uniref:Uncharacterized protein n=1 Tax=Oryza rufipogon TaxID=4529 RepID=A0A0E0R9P6_ORYRU
MAPPRYTALLVASLLLLHLCVAMQQLPRPRDRHQNNTLRWRIWWRRASRRWKSTAAAAPPEGKTKERSA